MPAPRIIITTTTTMSITTTEPALLRLLAWLSPAFPTGGFAYSHGIEWAVDAGDITDEPTLQALARRMCWRMARARSDAILLRHAHRAAHDADALAQIAELAAATAPVPRAPHGNAGPGHGLHAARSPRGSNRRRMTAVPVPYPVAVGALAGRHGIDADAAACGYLQAFAANLISAAVRLVPLGQSAGLRVLAALEPVMLAVAAEAADATLDDLGGCAFRSDLAAMRHETQYTRLFRS